MEIAFIITSLMISVLLGGVIVAFLEKKDKQNIIKKLQEYSG